MLTAVEIRLPELSGGTEAEQLRRMQNYLFTLAQQLQFAFDTVTQQSDSSKQQADSPSSGQENPAVDFAAVKALILKSAQLTEHFQEAVEERLTGLYVAQSQFGLFRQETEAAITANSQSIQQKFTSLQQLEAAVAGLESAVREVSATIRTGLLAETPEGGSIYGVEIGQQTEEDGTVVFQKFARLMANRLSFFDQNGVEVSYIGDETMHITRADIQILTAAFASVQKIQLGDYLLYAGSDGHLTLS